MSPVRKFRLNSPFTKQQSNFIINTFQDTKSLTKVMRAYRQVFFPKKPWSVPKRNTFQRLLDRFETDAAVRLIKPAGKSPVTLAEVVRVESYFKVNKKNHIRQAVQDLGFSFGKIWKILRKNLGWKAYRPHKVHILTPAHMESRLSACTFWLTMEENWFSDCVLWSDEKWFVLHQSPNKQNSCRWAPFNPHELVQCKQQGGKKVMAWVGIVDGVVLPVYWFEGSVDSQQYLEMLRTHVWPAIRHRATRKGYWMQQDGASPHVTAPVMEFLREKFGERLISRNSTHIWPPYSPDLSCLDFSFWAQAMAEVTRCKPSTLADLKRVVEEFADLVRRMCRNTRKRAQICVQQKGGYFEHLL